MGMEVAVAMIPTRDIARAIGCPEQLLLDLYRQGKLPRPTLVKACKPGSKTPYYRRMWPDDILPIVKAEHDARKAARIARKLAPRTRGRAGSIVVRREPCVFGLLALDIKTGKHIVRPCTQRSDGECEACRTQAEPHVGYRGAMSGDDTSGYGRRWARPGTAGGA